MAVPATRPSGVNPYIDMTIAAGSGSNECDITMQVKNSDGKDVDEVTPLLIWTSDAATGEGLSATAMDGFVDGGSGDDLGNLTQHYSIMAITDANGEYVLTITDTDKLALYVAVVNLKTGFLNVSRILATADYT